MAKGWFEIPGVQRGDRTLAEQMRGLDVLAAEVDGLDVLDLGCAEALILLELKARGAARCVGYEGNPKVAEVAARLAGPSGCDVRCADLNLVVPEGRFDVVLLLAILHKLDRPQAQLVRFAALASRLVVIRLPLGSSGEFGRKNRPEIRCDTRAVMPAAGFVLERDEEGPRGERVHYWRRVQT